MSHCSDRSTATSTYTFEIAVAHASTIGLHIQEIEFVGAALSDVTVVPPVAGDYCADGNLQSDRNQQPFSVLVDGGGTWACNVPTTGLVGQVMFAISAPTDVTELNIQYSRPVYAPGWKIYRDGAEVLSESANRGTSPTPTPVTFSYTLAAPGMSE